MTDTHQEIQHHADTHHTHNQHAKTDPFTHEERVLIEVARKLSVFDAHHHHHSHHAHVEYKRPEKLTTPLGLYALKKINAMNPDYLTETEKKLLKPSAPGVISGLGQGLLTLTVPAYVLTVWNNQGWVAFKQPKVLLPLAVLFGAQYGFQYFANIFRELQQYSSRKKLVNRYVSLHG